MGKADICVTYDIPLAEHCLKNKASIIAPNGRRFTEDNIGMAIATREIMGQIRGIGEATTGPTPFNKADRSKFLNFMETTVRSARALEFVETY